MRSHPVAHLYLPLERVYRPPPPPSPPPGNLAQFQYPLELSLFAFLFMSFMSLMNRPFPLPSSLGPLYQNEVKCSTFDMEMIFHSHANNTHFHKKGCALGLILKVRVFGTRKWPIVLTYGWTAFNAKSA